METNHVKYIQDSNFELIQVNHSFDWLNWSIVFICVVLVILARQSNYSYIPSLFKRQSNYNTNTISLTKLSSLLLLVNYYLVTSLFIWQYILELNIFKLNQNLIYLLILLSLMVISGLKLIIIYVIDVVFKRKNHFHIRFHFSFTQIIGIITLPLYIFSYFLFPNQNLDFFLNTTISKVDMYILVLIIFAITILFREVKSFFAALNERISLLYIILYLCTLEILPLILAIKILKG